MKGLRSSRSALALSLAAAFAISACSDSMAANHGRVRFVLGGDATAASIGATAAAIGADHDDDHDSRSDRPSHWFTTAKVTLSSILVRNTDGVLVSYNLPAPVTVDVVQLEQGRHITLPDGLLPAGEYDQVVLVMTAVQGTLLDGTIITIQPPGGGWTATIPICSFDVAEGSTDVVALDLNIRNSFSRGSTSSFNFQPRFKAETNCADN